MLRESAGRTASDLLAWHMEHSAVFLNRAGRPYRPRHKRDYAGTSSISPRRAASGSFSRVFSLLTGGPTSVTGKAIVQPQRVPYSRRAQICKGMVCWSLVETRAKGLLGTFLVVSVPGQKRDPISRSERPVLWALQEGCSAWPQSILFGQGRIHHTS